MYSGVDRQAFKIKRDLFVEKYCHPLGLTAIPHIHRRRSYDMLILCIQSHPSHLAVSVRVNEEPWQCGNKWWFNQEVSVLRTIIFLLKVDVVPC